jgi:hypothetical protein
VRVGVDSYSYHRLLGELRPGERPPPRPPFVRGSLDVVAEARRLELDVVSLETVFLPPPGRSTSARSEAEAGAGLQVMFAWGHPEGVAYGDDAAARRSWGRGSS